MKNYIFVLFIFTSSTLFGQISFRHISTASNTSGHITTLDHPSLNGQPNAIIQVTPDYRTVYNAHTVGAWYNGSRWTVYNQNRQTMPIAIQFNVLVETPSSTAFVHTATAANTGGHITTLDNPQLNGNPNALILVTQNYGVYNTNEVGVWYNGSRWTIYNENRQAMPANAKFNVSIQTGRATIHRATSATIWGQVNSGTRTIYDSPNDLLFVTHNYNPGSIYNINPTGLFYAPNLPQTWSILTGNTTAMPVNAGFNVLRMSGGNPTNCAQLPSATYESITLTTIQTRVSCLATNRIDGSNNTNNLLRTGTIVFYRTNEGRLGKAEILNYDYNIRLRCTTYNNDGSIYKQNNNLTIRGTWSCDFDNAIESSTGQDFFWQQATAIERWLTPQNGATFWVAKVGNDIPTPTNGLTGWVDMHTHPMSHLGFGKRLMHGVPDIGSIIPAGTRFKGFNAFEKECNTVDERATSIEQALGTCNATHGGWGVENDCGNYVRAITISKAFDDEYVYNVDHNPFTGGNVHGDHRHEGIETSPNFLYWPHQSSKVHQQMWWEWLKRAYKEGGLRVMVALTVNNELLAEVIDGDAPKDDKTTGDEQLDEIRDFVGRHNDFMEVAYSASDLRRIVSANKLAVILGMEVDNIGNFNKNNVVCNEETVKAEIHRLYDKGVRYIFPIHLTDNKFGGTAVYEDLFNYANKFSTGNLFTIQSSATIDPTITHRLGAGLDGAGNLGVKLALDAASGIPFPPAFHLFDCPIPTLGCWDKFKFIRNLLSPDSRFFSYAATPGGHANATGLTRLGVVAIREMMRLGILIDIDHMSQKAVDSTLTLAELNNNYPVNIGHNGLRGPSGNERGASQKTVERVAALGGVFGVGTADNDHDNTDAVKFISNVQSVSSTVTTLKGIGLGTDVNGMERLPRASQGLNSDAFYKDFPKCTTGNRTWDYTKEGVAHYGLMADFMKDVKERNINIYNKIMSSAEYFAQMWEKCDRLTTYRPTPIILPLYRLRNGGNHFYTVESTERDNALRSLGYVSEGTACSIFLNAQREGTVPLYRLRNGSRHFYTTNTAERDNAIRTLGYVSEGIAGHVFNALRERTIPLYRLRNGGNHFFTTNAAERDNATRSLGYVSEGIACYVFP